MFRFSLRTLLIFITCAGLLFGWIAFSRQMAAYHRQESFRLVGLIARSEGNPPDEVEDKIAALAQGRSVTRWVRATNGAGSDCTLFRNGGHMTFSDSSSANIDDWASAVYHAMMGERYELALYRPWIMFSGRSVSAQPVYAPLSDDKTWIGIARPPMTELKPY
jgi:hypothetical protein